MLKVEANNLEQMGAAAKNAAYELALLSTAEKNAALLAMADALDAAQAEILSANALDLKDAQVQAKFLDRLRLTPERIHDMASG